MWLEWDRNGDVSLRMNVDREEIKQIVSNSSWCEKVSLSGDVFEDQELFISYEPPIYTDDLYYFERPAVMYDETVLKSKLEKQIKRSVRFNVVAISLQFIRQNIKKFIGLLLYFISMNATIHKNTLHCLWLLIAVRKGWVVTKGQVLMLLNVVNDVANSSYCDVKNNSIALRFPVVKSKQQSIIQNEDLKWTCEHAYKMVENYCAALLLYSACYYHQTQTVKYMMCSCNIWKRRLETGDNRTMSWIRFLKEDSYNFNRAEYRNKVDERIHVPCVKWSDVELGVYNIENCDINFVNAVDYYHFPDVQNKFFRLRHIVKKQNKLDNDCDYKLSDNDIGTALYYYRTIFTAKKCICDHRHLYDLEYTSLFNIGKMKLYSQTWKLIRPYLDLVFKDVPITKKQSLRKKLIFAK